MEKVQIYIRLWRAQRGEEGKKNYILYKLQVLTNGLKLVFNNDLKHFDTFFHPSYLQYESIHIIEIHSFFVVEIQLLWLCILVITLT